MKYADFMPKYLAKLDEIRRFHATLTYLRGFVIPGGPSSLPKQALLPDNENLKCRVVDNAGVPLRLDVRAVALVASAK